MKTRVISCIILIAILVLCMPFAPTRVLFFGTAGILCAYELCKNLKEIDINCTAWVLYAYLVIQIILSITKCGLMAYLAWFTLAIFIALFSGILHEKVSGKGALYTLAALCYPCFLFALMMIISISDRWMQTLALACVSVWTCDSFALFGGKWWGKHKVAPLVSPNKTIEGCLAGAVMSLVAGLAVYFVSKLISPIPLIPCLVTALAASTMGQIGDLAESLVKRYIGIKDFSNLIPGHGGMFDRADSLMFAIPTAYFCLYVFKL